MAYLVMTKNDIAFDNLEIEDLEILESADEDDCFEILNGDESLQHSLGEKWKISDLNTFEVGDKLVSSYVKDSEIPFPFLKKQAYYAEEFIYECI